MGSGLKGFLKRVFLHGENPFVDRYATNRLRPPGAVNEERFMALCIRCNRCLEVCPYGSIKRAGWGTTIGTPYVLPEDKACYLCMACCRLCPTGALNPTLRNPEKVRMGKASIDASICYSRLFFDHDVLPDTEGRKIGAICNTCYNVCPLADKAIMLKDNLFPVVLDGCVGCGICVEKCPTRPARAVNVTPAGMGKVDEAGFYFRKARKSYETSVSVNGEARTRVLKGSELLDRKYKIEGSTEPPAFRFPYDVPDSIEDWE
ncbi:MAG: 4Fe-4S dicluster domain-containing protein [Desulfomonilaceae bacterium]|nr:4Fe-4S dicluster domain-containing protein [Desulfomonilaceae bacterium]